MKKGNADRKWRRNEPVILKVPVPVRERLFAELAAHRLLAGVELLDVEPEVGLAPTGGGTELTLVLGLVSGICMNRLVCFQTVALRELGVANITLVRLFSCRDNNQSLNH